MDKTTMRPTKDGMFPVEVDMKKEREIAEATADAWEAMMARALRERAYP